MVIPICADEMTHLWHLAAILAAALPLAGLSDYVPDGREWQDHTRLSSGTLAPRAVFGSFPDVASARHVLSSLSPRTVSLDGQAEWRFRWSRRPSERPQGFERPDYDVSDWPVVKVPCSWQAMGIRASGERFGTPIYVNQQYIFTPPFPENTNCWPRVLGNRLPADWTFSPDDNPVGSYRRQFTVPRDWDGDRIVLRFDGVESFFYVWVNGHCLGFAKDSRAVSEFDITDVVRHGDNTLAVEVYRNSDGSYLECHDVYRLSGIHRSVYLTHLPKTHLRDVALSVAPLCAGECRGKWAVDVVADVVGPGHGRLTAHVFGPCGTAAQFEGGIFDKSGRARLVFDSPKLWNAEEPSLYTLVVALEINGKVVEAAGFDLGFREP
ncbi:MAG: beta-galactosidase, partial [Kiritimatiellae bacterium]|nr:beta-galactosidase [Kiritimatiellia bacterium]